MERQGNNMGFGKIIAERPNKTIYRDGMQTVKVFGMDFSKSDILNEALNQARVEETGLAIPKVIEVSKTEDGRWAIISEFIEGRTLAEIMEEQPQNMSALLERFVDIQLEMHKKRAPLLNRLYDKMHYKIDQTTLDDATKYDLHTRLSSRPKREKLCHGDFNPSNIIITPNDEAYVIDWSHATQGSASADVARTYLLFQLQNETETAEKYVDLFCEKTGTPKTYVQGWLPIVAASQSVKGKPEEREFLLRWVNVMDYE